MAKTLVIAEKPSVARDLSNALPGSYKQSKDKSHLIGDDYVITWAVGHLVGLAEPDAYDDGSRSGASPTFRSCPSSSSSCPTTTSPRSSSTPSTG